MGVYIKGVTSKQLMKVIMGSSEFMPDDFEIIEIAEPHGRLIDADALADDLEYDAANEQDFYKENCASWLRSNCNQTIIEAEGK